MKLINLKPVKNKMMSMRDMLKITRNISLLNEDTNTNNSNSNDGNNTPRETTNNSSLDNSNNNFEDKTNKENIYDEKREKEKFLSLFKNLNVHVNFYDLIITNNYVFWGGTINGMIQFAYKVTDDKQTSGVEFNYLEDFSPETPENDQIIKIIESYYDSFFKYWNNNLMQKV